VADHHCPTQLFKHASHVGFDLLVPETRDSDTQLIDDEGSEPIMIDAIVVNASIDLDHQLSLEAEEVSESWRYMA
jgi:hypothetical protein